MLPFVDIHTVDCSLTVCVCVSDEMSRLEAKAREMAMQEQLQEQLQQQQKEAGQPDKRVLFVRCA